MKLYSSGFFTAIWVDVLDSDDLWDEFDDLDYFVQLVHLDDIDELLLEELD